MARVAILARDVRRHGGGNLGLTETTTYYLPPLRVARKSPPRRRHLRREVLPPRLRRLVARGRAPLAEGHRLPLVPKRRRRRAHEGRRLLAHGKGPRDETLGVGQQVHFRNSSSGRTHVRPPIPVGVEQNNLKVSC